MKVKTIRSVPYWVRTAPLLFFLSCLNFRSYFLTQVEQLPLSVSDYLQKKLVNDLAQEFKILLKSSFFSVLLVNFTSTSPHQLTEYLHAGTSACVPQPNIILYFLLHLNLNGCTNLSERTFKCLMKAFRQIKRRAHRYVNVLKKFFLFLLQLFFSKDQKN